jgi:hypothetical protein
MALRLVWASRSMSARDRLGTLEHLRIGHGASDPLLERETILFGDAAVVELGDNVQLRAGHP